ncbi:hypothetical protein [Iodobacter sp.]|nr:hypothetical protein [Iodobacter sp.]
MLKDRDLKRANKLLLEMGVPTSAKEGKALVQEVKWPGNPPIFKLT